MASAKTPADITSTAGKVIGRYQHYAWPAAFVLEDDRPDGIEILLPRCHLYVSEGFESEITLKFAADSTGLSSNVSVRDVIARLREDPERVLPPPPALSNYFSPAASLEKVKHRLHDQLLLLFTYFRPSLIGDFDWVPSYRTCLAKHGT